IPGTDVLADVASEGPVAERLGLLVGDRAFVLDRPVADASSGVELIRPVEGIGRAGFEASGAGPAVVRLVWGIVGQFEIDQHRAKDREATGLAIDQAGVLADPAQSGQPGEVALQQWRGIAYRPADDSRTL